MQVNKGSGEVASDPLRNPGMNRLFTFAAVPLIGCLLSVGSATSQVLSARQTATETDRWPTERVELRDGRRYEGYIESEGEVWVRLIQIRRRPGRPMYVVIRPIERASVRRLVHLEADQRAELRRRIDEFLNRARIEAGRMEAIRLRLVTREAVHYRQYRGKWFTLESTAEEAITRRIVVRTDQIFTAYRQVLPPQTESRRPLRLVVLGSIEQYQAYLERLNVQIKSRACFIPGENLVVAASELERFAAQLKDNRQHHAKLLAQLKELVENLPQRLNQIARQLQQSGSPREEIKKVLTTARAGFERQIQQIEQQVKRCERENAQAFDKVTGQMFVRLYHEAFHAYLENYVYPQDNHDVPRWLNEGLAVVCEGGLLESGTLRIDAPNSTALERLKADLAGQHPLPLAELLAAGPQAFVNHGAADRYYAYSWGLAYYLTFEQRLLGSPAMDQYVRQSAEAAPPAERFEKLVGMPLSQFESRWRQYILNLR